jgi:uncharacterized protein DUF4928
MTLKKTALNTFIAWYENLPTHIASGGPAKGTIAAALVVLERLKSEFALELEAHRAPGGSQIKGASGQAVKKILVRFGELRPFAKEGGRTNRGGPGDIKPMLDALKAAKLDTCDASERNAILDELQQVLVRKVVEFHNRERIKLVYDPAKTTWQAIQQLLAQAKETGKEGPLAQYLVGAKLELRFPEIEVGNESYSTADDQLGRPGDFYIGDTAFHVTVAPMPALYEKCQQNLNDGLRIYLLVPDRTLSGARQNADLILPGRIAVESIESFVSQNIEELSVFSKKKLTAGLRQLLETYNKRVDACEIDKSMLVEIPKNI